MTDGAEREFLGGKKAKLWTYLILGFVVLGGVLVGNFALSNPEAAKAGVQTFLGLPSWAFPSLAILVGAGVFWLGLKIEADWPEALGAAMISGAIATFQIMIGWQKFAIGGLTVIPYLIPLVLFLVLLVFGMIRSK